MRVLPILVLMMTFLTTGVIKADINVHTSSEGLPLPWPFPWAKECPMDWRELGGHYMLADTDLNSRLDITISASPDRGLRLVRVARYTSYGQVLYQGFAAVSENLKTIRVELMPAEKDQLPIQAIIKLFYQSSQIGCAADHLVPILTLVVSKDCTTQKIQYKMVKMEDPKK